VIQQELLKKRTNDTELLRELALTQDAVGSILFGSHRYDEAIVHYRQSLDLFRQLHDRLPDDTYVEFRARTANFRIAGAVMALGRTREALEQYILPYGKRWLERSVDPTLPSWEAHMSFVAHEMVGHCEMEMEQPTKALPQFEAAFRWKQMQVEREPSDARYARDWGWIHSLLGTTQIALGRFDEGITNLQESVHIAEGVLGRDPLNGSAQSALFGRLRALAQGLIKIARAPEISPVRRAELWQQATQALVRCQAILTSPAAAKLGIHDGITHGEIARELDEARAVLAKLGISSDSKSGRP
jgi:tetratricopeptide (TPR) repeat protein